jgi:hypothetical protein
MHRAVQSGASRIGRDAFLASWNVESLSSSTCKYTPPFPALPTTLVRLDILLQARVVDLQKIVGLLRCDPGLAAEILRLSGRRGQDAPFRLHECVLHLGIRSLSRAAQIVPSWAHSVGHEDMWYLRWRLKRARLTALAAESISSTMGDIPAEQAYLAGLLHDLPGMICLDKECACKWPGALACLNSWNLPAYADEVIRWHTKPGYAAPEHFAMVQRIAAARAWVDEVELSDSSLPLGWLRSVSQKSVWRHLPDRGTVLRGLADELNYWRVELPD